MLQPVRVEFAAAAGASAAAAIISGVAVAARPVGFVLSF